MTGLIDVHCHILPGVDDGAHSMEESIRLLKAEYAQGVREVILTPHLRIGMFETPAGEIEDAYRRLCVEGANDLPDMKLHLGCEFHMTSRMTAILKEESCRTMCGTKYVLTEFSGRNTEREVRERISELLRFGYRPVIAHAERYGCIRSSFAFLEELCHMGAYIQMNAASVSGKDGRDCRNFCKKALKCDCLHLIGTDAHDTRSRAPDLGDCAEYLIKKYGEAAAHTLLIDNPKKLLANEYI